MAFHIPHVQILGKNHCGDSLRTALKLRESFQYMVYLRDYADRVVASFPHQIQSEYYGVNRSVYFEGIILENFSALPLTEINSCKKPCSLHEVFHYFLSDDSKQDADTTTAHRNCLIELLKK